MTKRFSTPSVDYDENYDLCQESEDDWVTDIIGSEDQLIGELLKND